MIARSVGVLGVQADDMAGVDVVAGNSKCFHDIPVALVIIAAGADDLRLGGHRAVDHVIVRVGAGGDRWAEHGEKLHEKGQDDEDHAGAADGRFLAHTPGVERQLLAQTRVVR